jgi:hypothetical protein
VSEPPANDIYFDAGFEEMDGGRVPKCMGTDSAAWWSRLSGFDAAGMLPHAFINTEASQRSAGSGREHQSASRVNVGDESTNLRLRLSR